MLFFALLVASSFASVAAPAASPRRIATLIDFSNSKREDATPILRWSWTEEQKANAAQYSSMDVSPAPDGDGNVLRIELRDGFPWAGLPEGVRNIGNAYFPPEADAVVVRARAFDGDMIFAIGSPTAYFGDSDVCTAPYTLSPSDGWVDARCDLHRGLVRNWRRAGFGRESLSVQYNRWAQEIPRIYLMPGSGPGTLMVHSVWLESDGRGAPFPGIPESAVEERLTSRVAEENAFSMLIPYDNKQLDSFRQSWAGAGIECHYPAIEISTREDGSLASSAIWSEEIRWAGLKIPAMESGNIVEVSMKLETSIISSLAGEDGGDGVQPVDFAIFCKAPDESSFPWDAYAPDPEWLKSAGPGVKGHDYCISFTDMGKGRSFGIYHARRHVRAGEWARIAIPLADFQCIAAGGELYGDLSLRKPPQAKDVVAIGWLAPFARYHKGGPQCSFQVRSAGMARARIDGSGVSYPAPVPGVRCNAQPEMRSYGGYVQFK